VRLPVALPRFGTGCSLAVVCAKPFRHREVVREMVLCTPACAPAQQSWFGSICSAKEGLLMCTSACATLCVHLRSSPRYRNESLLEHFYVSLLTDCGKGRAACVLSDSAKASRTKICQVLILDVCAAKRCAAVGGRVLHALLRSAERGQFAVRHTACQLRPPQSLEAWARAVPGPRSKPRAGFSGAPGRGAALDVRRRFAERWKMHRRGGLSDEALRGRVEQLAAALNRRSLC